MLANNSSNGPAAEPSSWTQGMHSAGKALEAEEVRRQAELRTAKQRAEEVQDDIQAHQAAKAAAAAERAAVWRAQEEPWLRQVRDL